MVGSDGANTMLFAVDYNAKKDMLAAVGHSFDHLLFPFNTFAVRIPIVVLSQGDKKGLIWGKGMN